MKFSVEQLKGLGIDVEGALLKVGELHKDHHGRYPALDPATGKKSVHVPLPIEKVVRVAKDALAGNTIEADLLSSMVAVLNDSITEKTK